jgi:hypothetical protein
MMPQSCGRGDSIGGVCGKCLPVTLDTSWRERLEDSLGNIPAARSDEERQVVVREGRRAIRSKEASREIDAMRAGRSPFLLW